MSKRIIKYQASKFRTLFKPFSFILIIISTFFIGLELFLALLGVRPAVLYEDPLVGFSGNIPLYVESTQPDKSIVMKTAENKIDWFNEQSFPKLKDKNSYRIFCLGGSTTVGRPYKDSTSFCGWLRLFLQTIEPNRNWEVINAGGVSYASYRVARLMHELVQYQPDLFIVYSGQNEFLEERSYGDLKKLPDWLIETNSLLSKTRTYTAVDNVLDMIKPKTAKAPEQQPTLLSSEVNEILSKTRGPTSYHRNEILKQQVVEHYRINLERMVKIARNADAEIMFVNPIANLKDMTPFKSEHKEGITEEEIASWTHHFQQGVKYNQQGLYSDAIHSYRQALAIDDRYAQLHFDIGRAQFSLGEFDAAESSFLRAIEEDIAPLRILSEMRDVVAGVAERQEVPLVDYRQIIKDAYRKKHPHTIFGKEYFLDHVHLTIAGYRLLAQELLAELIEQGIATPSNPLSEEKIKQITQKVYSGIDKEEQRIALTKLGRVIDWAGKFEEAYYLFEMNLKLFGPHALTYNLMGKTAYRSGKIDLAIENMEKSLQLDPDRASVHENLAHLLKEKGNIDKAIKHLQEATRIDHDNVTAHEQVAILLTTKGKIDAASHHFLETLRINPDDSAAMLNYIVFLVKVQRDDEAMVWIEEILKKGDFQAQAHNIKGVLLANKGKQIQAVEHFKEALRINPNLKSAEANLIKAEATLE